MASSPLRSKSHYHVRSISLTSRSHPLIPQFNEHLCRLRSSEGTSISNWVSGLEDLYDCVENLLLLPHTQQALAQESHKKVVDEALDGYLKLLDACGAIKDIFSQTKEDVQQLLSSLRRKRDAGNFGGFLASRKKVQKLIKMLLKDLKGTGEQGMLPVCLDKDQAYVAIASMLKAAEAVTLSVLGSFLLHAAGTKLQSRPNRWSLMCKLIHHKSTVASQANQMTFTEFQEIDAAVQSFILSGKYDDKKTIETVQNQMGKLELSIQGLEEDVERLIRRLIKTRVSLLNIMNH